MNAEDALLAIQEVMDGVEWNSDTTQAIAEIMIKAGYKLHDLDGDLLNDAGLDREMLNLAPLTEALTGLKSGIVQNLAEARGIPVVDIEMRKAVYETIMGQPMRIVESAPAQQDHARIWLQNAEDANEQLGGPGRQWCHDKVWPETEGEREPIEYVRKDFYDAAVEDQIAATKQNLKLRALLKSIISDVTSMRAKDREGSLVSVKNWLVGFSEWTENPDDPTVAIEWPNLAISIGEAETYLKELECPASSSS